MLTLLIPVESFAPDLVNSPARRKPKCQATLSGLALFDVDDAKRAYLIKTPQQYILRDAFDDRFYVKAELNAKGDLELVFSTKVIGSDGKAIYSKLRAKDEFANIISHFGARAKKIKLVYTRLDDADAPMDDMLNRVNNLTSRGMSLDSAVGTTFFAREAFRHGFRTIHVDSPDGALPGSYEILNIEISK